MPIGSQPFGGSAFVTGSIVEPAEPPEPQSGALYIEPRSRDYRIDSSTLDLERMPAVRQRVYLLVVSTLGSSSVLPIGTKLPDHIGDSFSREAEASITLSLSGMVEAGEITLDAVLVDTTKKPGQALITVKYTDLTTGEPDFVQL